MEVRAPVNILHGTGHPSPRESSDPHGNSAEAKKPWSSWSEIVWDFLIENHGDWRGYIWTLSAPEGPIGVVLQIHDVILGRITQEQGQNCIIYYTSMSELRKNFKQKDPSPKIDTYKLLGMQIKSPKLCQYD